MMSQTVGTGWVSLMVGGALCWGLASPPTAVAHEPDSPVVLGAIEKGIRYLEQNDHDRLGGKALIGLTFAKYGAERDHPKIQAGIEAVQRATANGPERVPYQIYDIGICIMFLVALDPSEFNSEIETLVKALHHFQKDEGAWGYPPTHNHGKDCDTSMTQYAVLGLWEAQELAGVITPPEVWDRCAEWLIRTQDPTGAFGYQGNVSNDLNQRVKQSGVRHSMAVAGGACVYIVRHMLGFTDLRKPADDDTPSQLRVFEDDQERKARITSQLDARLLDRCVHSISRWVSREYAINPPKTQWLHYYLYGLERFESLRLAERLGAAASEARTPMWYHQGSNHLVSSQSPQGSWNSRGEVHDTCFAILFLLRSTKKSLEKSGQRYESGLLVAGRGLPGTADEVRVREGRLVVMPEGSLGRALDVLTRPERADGPDTLNVALEVLADAAQSADPQALADHTEVLAYLAAHHNGETQRLAIRALARSRDLKHAPLLVRLLSSDDPKLVLAARDALRTLSRRYEGFGLSPSASAEQRAQVIDAWRGWLAAADPNADVDGYMPPSQP